MRYFGKMKSIQILKEISQLISSVEDSSIQKTDKLKIIKVLFAIKLKLIELLEKELMVPVQIIDDPMTSVVRGSGIALENIDALANLVAKEDEWEIA